LGFNKIQKNFVNLKGPPQNPKKPTKPKPPKKKKGEGGGRSPQKKKKNRGNLSYWGTSFGRLERISGLGQPRKFYNCGQLEVHLGCPQGEMDLAICLSRVGKFGMRIWQYGHDT